MNEPINAQIQGLGFISKKRFVEIQKQKYYNSEGELELPRHTRYYFDWLCSEFKSIPMEEKLCDLAYMLTKGFDLQQSVLDYKSERDEYITRAVPQTFLFYILYMRYAKYHHFSEIVLRKLSENRLIQLFIDEIKLRYDEYDHRMELFGWNDKKLIESADSDKVKFKKLVTTAMKVI